MTHLLFARWKKAFRSIVFISLACLFCLFIDASTEAETINSTGGTNKIEENGKENELEEVLDGFHDLEPVNQSVKSPESTDVDDVLEGFDDSGGLEEEISNNFERMAWWEIAGYFKASTCFNFAHEAPETGKTDHRGLSRLRGEIDLKLDFDLPKKWHSRISGNFKHDLAFALNGKDDYTNDMLDEMETEIELREAFIQGALMSNLDIKLGHQIVVWGTSESIRVVDILNPLDRRELGIVDIEDLRLAVAMTRLDYYRGPWSITGIAIHEMRFHKEPPFGSDFYAGSTNPPPEKIPANTLDNTETAIVATGRFSGWDLTFHAARYFNDESHLETTVSGRTIRTHDRLSMAGSTIVAASGNWIYKAEVAYIKGLEFHNLPKDNKSRLDILAGLEYSGITQTIITLEIVNRHLFDHDDRLADSPDNSEKDQFQSALRMASDFINDTVHLTLLAGFQGETGQDGSFQRMSLEYDWTDSISLTVGGILYQSGDLVYFNTIKDNDRVFFDIKYSF